MEDIEDSVPSHLKCPICLEIPKDKVFQCKFGHIFCGDCYGNLSNTRCPQCRIYLPTSPIRCRAVEEMLDRLKLEFPCPFQSSGCEQKLDRTQIAEHTSSCKYDIENVYRFGNLRNVCGLFGFINCSFAFNRANVEEAVVHFKSVHKMLYVKALLSDLFTIIYEDFAKIYDSKEIVVFRPLIFDQKWWGHNCIYIIVTRFNPLDKTLQFTPFYLVHGGNESFYLTATPEPIEFSLRHSRGIIYPQHLLTCAGKEFSDSSYFAAPLKNWFNVEKPETFSSTLQIRFSQHYNLQRPQDNHDDVQLHVKYRPYEVLTRFPLNHSWSPCVRQVSSARLPQDWDQFGWIALQDYQKCKIRFTPASFSFEMEVLICRANIDEKWLVGFIGVYNEKNLISVAYFKTPDLLTATETLFINDNFEILYTPPNSFEWVAWPDLKDNEPILVHDEEKDLLICETTRVAGVSFIGAVEKDMQPEDDQIIHVLVSKSN